MTSVWRVQKGDDEFEIYQIPCFEDSFTYLVSSRGVAISIDPGEGKGVQEELENRSLVLEAILLTHHHKAHVKDAPYLRMRTDATIIGPKHEDLDFVDQDVMDEDECLIADFTVQVIALPGHTMDHLGYYFPDCKAFFSGDALYFGGCGKMLGGDENQYFESMQKIKKLPPDTWVFGGHGKGSQVARILIEEIKENPFLQVTSPAEFLKVRNEMDIR